MPDQPSLAVTGQVLLLALTIVAAIYDIRFRRIPNWLVLAGLAAGLIWRTWSGGWQGLGNSAEGLGVGFALYFPLYLLRARGAGDVKLLAAVGSIAGPLNCLWLFMLTAILGGVIALIMVAVSGRLKKTLFNVQWIGRDLMRLQAPYKSNDELDVRKDKGMRLPHGVMILVGTIAFVAIVHFGLPA